jgi:hypothetical protein
MIGAVSVAVSVTKHLTSVPVLDTFIAESRSTRDAFREGTFGRRSDCGARARMNAIRSRADPVEHCASLLLMAVH